VLKDRKASKKYFLFLKETKSPEKEGQKIANFVCFVFVFIIKMYTLNSGNARRDDKIVSTVKDGKNTKNIKRA